MGYFQVRYNSRVINYDHRGFIRLATGFTEIFMVMKGFKDIDNKVKSVYDSKK